jgi:Ni,Fe-hydrogenase I large subunit
MSDYPKSTAPQFAGVQDRLKAFVAGGRLGPFDNGYWGHPAYQLSPEMNLIALSHYLDALDFQRDYVQVHAILGGKNPHPQSYLVGGMSTAIDPAEPSALNENAMSQIRGLLQRGLDFVNQVYLPDLMAIAGAYPQWASIGGGTGNYLAFGDFAKSTRRHSSPITDGVLPGGVLWGRKSTHAEGVVPQKIAEFAKHSWFSYERGTDAGLSPWDGESTPHYTGPKPPYEQLDVDAEYSWLKSPRYDGRVVEVGPLARVMIAYARRNKRFVRLVDDSLTQLKVGREALVSTLGRTLARGLESVVMAEHAIDLLDTLQTNIAGGDLQIHNDDLWNPSSWPKEARGVGYHEAPRGGLSHWVVIDNGRIGNYQAVVPTTWNAGPRDAKGQPGPYEAALVGTPLADPARPLEVLRTVHSFDPCMACAAHILDADGNPLTEVRVQ